MHLRFSIARGTPVMENETGHIVGRISGILLHPDNGQVIGFFVQAGSLVFARHFFLSTNDILSWGTRVHIRNREKLVPPEDLIRLESLLADPRTILRQRIVTKKGRKDMGVCIDVQFDTRHFRVEWLFPRKYFFSRTPIPASSILEVTPKAIVIKEEVLQVKETAKEDEVVPVLPLQDVVIPPANA